MTTTVLEQVRRLVTEAERAGHKAPGRTTLRRLTGATEHQVRQALAVLATAGGDAGEPLVMAGASLAPAITSPPPEAFERPAVKEPERVEPDTAGDGLAGPGEPLATVSPGRRQRSPAVASVPPGGGQAVAWAGFAFGSVVSVFANVLAARLAPAGAPANWQPSVYAQVGAAVWPVALLLSVEVLSRVRWPAGGWWRVARYGGVGLVAACSAVISYQHVRDVLVSWGYPTLSAGVGPLVIDGLMVASGFALLANAGGAGENDG